MFLFYLPEFNFDTDGWVIDLLYILYPLVLQVKYPSALTSFEQITNFAKGKRIALFLDYDGTLSPIVDNPDCAFMSDDVRMARLTNYLQIF